MHRTIMTVLGVVAALSATNVAAQDNSDLPAEMVGFVEETGAAERIHAADRLRAVSQELSAASCFLHNGIDVDFNRDHLEHSVAEFDALLAALISGDEEMHIIGAETHRKTLMELEALKADWEPIHAAAETLADSADNAAAVTMIYEASAPMLDATSHLLSQLEGRYVRPTEVLMADLMLIQFAGQQAMLTQKIAFETCLVWSGYGGEEQIADLATLTNQFDVIARALHDGLQSVGIMPAPTEEIRIALEEVVIDWTEVRERIDHITAGNDVLDEELQWIGRALFEKMEKMEIIETMYTDYSHRAQV